MQIKFMGIKHILFSILNKGEEDTSDYAIAYYLLAHYQTIKEINIIDMATACYVDRSTIRRFFQKYGFANFQEFKRNYSDEFEERYYKDLPFHTYQEYIMDLNTNILNMMSQYTLKRDKSADIDQFIDRMHQANRIILMGDDSLYGDMYTIQQYMLAVGKIVYIVTSHMEHNAFLTHLQENDCILVLSLKGNYYKEIKAYIKDCKCKKMLLTLCAKEQWQKEFDYIAQLTSEPDKVEEDVYRKYAVTYFIDITLNTYKMKYKGH